MRQSRSFCVLNVISAEYHPFQPKAGDDRQGECSASRRRPWAVPCKHACRRSSSSGERRVLDCPADCVLSAVLPDLEAVPVRVGQATDAARQGSFRLRRISRLAGPANHRRGCRRGSKSPTPIKPSRLRRRAVAQISPRSSPTHTAAPTNSRRRTLTPTPTPPRPATHTATPVHTQAPATTAPPPAAPTTAAPPAPTTAPPAAPSCYPTVASSGNCYEPGQFCPQGRRWHVGSRGRRQGHHLRTVRDPVALGVVGAKAGGPPY